jgi:hypothetical protein
VREKATWKVKAAEKEQDRQAAITARIAEDARCADLLAMNAAYTASEGKMAEMQTKTEASARSAAWEQAERENATQKVKAAEEEQARLSAMAARVAEETRRAEEDRLAKAKEAAANAAEEEARQAAAANS